MNLRKNSRLMIGQVGLIAAGSLSAGALYQAILAVGRFWPGFLAASLLIFLCSITLYLAWHAAGRGKTLAWLMFLAFFVRLALGLFLAWGLPRFGYDEDPQLAGFVFEDAYRRDGSAWTLAQSGEPLLVAFSDAYETDQYGGILALSASIYRTFSPDAYRPALISILAAGAMVLSLPFLMSVVQRQFDRKTGIWAGIILGFYPEGVLLASSQMREPFFILFFAIVIWSVSYWLDRRRLKVAIPVFLFSAVSLLLFSFRIAVPILGVVLLWVWVVESAGIKKAWIKAVGWVVIGIGVAVAIWVIRDWIAEVLRWDTLQTVTASGRVQFQLESLPAWLHFPFVLIYGIFQPVLPAAIAAPAPWIWRSLGIFRALGWYAVLPLLVYALIRVWHEKSVKKKRWLIVMIVVVVGWIVISSARAGGDQWDNPRYRTIFLPWIAFVCSWSLQFASRTRDRWLTRGVIVEGIFLAFFTEWYISRYYPIIPRLNFWVMIVLIFLLSLAVVIGGWLQDRKRAQNSLTADGESL